METATYDAHHQHPFNRAAHMVGIPLIAVSGVLAAWPSAPPFGVRRGAALACFAGAWGLLWLGHAVEGNRPVVLRQPSAIWGALRWWGQRFSSVSGGSPSRALSDNPRPAPAPDVSLDS